MNEAYVAQYAAIERNHWWFNVRKQILQQFLKKNFSTDMAESRVLNVGAAGGASSEWLRDFGTVVSVENDVEFINHLEKINVDVVKASVEKLPFEDNTFDLVCAFDVLEHVEADKISMQELVRVCKPGGVVSVTVPAFNSLWSFHDEVNQHFRRYSKSSMAALINNVGGISTRQLYYFNFFLFVPVLIARKVANFFGRQKASGQSDFTFYKSGPMDLIMRKIFSLELGLLPHIKFPFGISLLAIVKKDGVR